MISPPVSVTVIAALKLRQGVGLLQFEVVLASQPTVDMKMR